MHVLIFEPNHKGHRLTTVRVLLDSLLEIGAQNPGKIESITLAVTTMCLESEEYRTQLAPLSPKFQTTILPEFAFNRHPFYTGWKQLRNLRKLLKTCKYDHAYVPYADAILQMLLLRKLLPLGRPWPTGTTVEAQIMRSSFAYPFTKRSRQMLSLLSVKYADCDRVHLNDPLAIDCLQRTSPHTLQHTRLIPDPITETVNHDKDYARKQLDLPLDSSIIGCVGVINKRKGADTLLRSFIMADLPENVYLLLAGKLDPGIAEHVEELSDSRIIALNRYLTEDELSYTLSAVDLIATPYPLVVGSASIVIRAAVARRMVLTNDTGWCGHIVSKFKLGKIASVTDIPAFSRVLSESIKCAKDYSHPSAETEYFISFNNIGNVHAHWTSLIREKLNLPEDSRKISWDV